MPTKERREKEKIREKNGEKRKPVFERCYRILEYLKENTDRDHTVTMRELQRIDGLRGYIWSDFTTAKQEFVNMAETLNTDAEGSLRDETEWKLVFPDYKKKYGHSGEEDGADCDGINGEDDFDEENDGGEEKWRVDKIYYQHPFSDAEVQELTEAVRFSRTLNEEESRNLIEKIERHLTSKYNRKPVSVRSIREISVDRKLLAANLRTIQEAFFEDAQIHFSFNHYDEKKRLHPHWETDVSPYELIAYNGRYYLLGITGSQTGKGRLWIVRVDLMSDVRKLERKRLAKDTAPYFPRYWDERFIHTHLNMSYDEPVLIKLKVTTGRLTFLYDAFGTPGADFKIGKCGEDGAREVTVRCSPFGMVNFAMQYSGQVEVISPKSLREQVKERVREMAEKYGVQS